jgi:hypothetical protein
MMLSPKVVNGARPLPPPGNLGKASTLATPREEKLSKREKTNAPSRKRKHGFRYLFFSMTEVFT